MLMHIGIKVTSRLSGKPYAHLLIADAASEPEASEQVSSSNSYWALKVRFYFRFSDQNALLLTDQNASLLTNQNALHVRCYKCSCFGVFCIHCMVC
jgi:hypothetical protein